MAIWTLEEAAAYLDMTPTDLLRLGEAGPPTHRRGRKVSFLKEELVKFKKAERPASQAYTPPIRAEPPRDKGGLVSIMAGTLLRCVPYLDQSRAQIVAENILGDLRAHRVGMHRRRRR